MNGSVGLYSKVLENIALNKVVYLKNDQWLLLTRWTGNTSNYLPKSPHLGVNLQQI